MEVLKEPAACGVPVEVKVSACAFVAASVSVLAVKVIKLPLAAVITRLLPLRVAVKLGLALIFGGGWFRRRPRDWGESSLVADPLPHDG
jgi:hypothetical protein